MASKRSRRIKLKPSSADSRQDTTKAVKPYKGFHSFNRPRRAKTYTSAVKPKPIKVRPAAQKSKCDFFKQKRYKTFLPKFITFVATTLGINIQIELDYVITEWAKLCQNKGVVYSTKLFKQLYDVYLRIITSNSFTPIPYLAVNARGEPKLLGPLLKLSRGSLNERRAGLYALSIIKLVTCEDPEFSTSTITQEQFVPKLDYNGPVIIGNYFNKVLKSGCYNGEVDLNHFAHCFKLTLKSMFPDRYREKRLEKISKLGGIHLSGRNGPNGPCLSTAVLDHWALTDPRKEESQVYKSIKSICSMTNNKDLQILIENFEEEIYEFSSSKSRPVIHSRISLKREAWAKTRPFAICDYFSQSALKGLHNYLFRWLENQPEDGTFKQDTVSDAVRSWTDQDPDLKSRAESADLSAATDSIPVEVQVEILTQIAGPKLALQWYRIVSDREFTLPNGTIVKYNKGQPMGLLSSWSMLAVWHHVMMRSVQRYLKIPRNIESPGYYVIGDDVSMKGTNQFSIYREVVGTIQGIGISKTKGFHMETQSQDNPIPFEGNRTMHTAELAKRVFCCGQEITVIPPDEVLTSFEDAIQFPQLLVSIEKRGFAKLQITQLPVLTSLCHHKKLALLLATDPKRCCAPLRELTDTQIERSPWNTIFWFKPEYNESDFTKAFINVLKGQSITTLRRLTENLSKWTKLAVTGGEVKVKDWKYVCETQGVLWWIVSSKAKLALQDILSEDKILGALREPESNRGSKYHELIRSLEVLFDIDHLFKETDINKRSDRRYFTNLLIGKAVTTTVRQLALR